MSVKQMKPFMTKVFLNAENETSDFLVASCFNRVIVLKQKMLILIEFIKKSLIFLYFVNKIEFLINRSVQVECHLKQRK